MCNVANRAGKYRKINLLLFENASLLKGSHRKLFHRSDRGDIQKESDLATPREIVDLVERFENNALTPVQILIEPGAEIKHRSK